MNIIITESQYNRLFENDYGYHSGDLGKSSSDGLHGLNSSNGTRHTGHFGSGTYFFSSKDKADSYGKHEGRPTHEIPLKNYKLFKPRDNKEALELHRIFEIMNNEYVTYPRTAPKTIEEYNKRRKLLLSIIEKYNRKTDMPTNDFKHFVKVAETLEDYGYWARSKRSIYNIVERCLRYGWDKPSIMQEVYDELKNSNILNHLRSFLMFPDKYGFKLAHIFHMKFDDIVNIIYDTRDYATSHYFYRDLKDNNYNFENTNSLIDSASTYFMKRLGYEGIDVRHCDQLDNGMYGSVVYDLNQ